MPKSKPSPFVNEDLAREYARLSGPDLDGALGTFVARRTVQAADRLIWSASVGPIKTTALLPSDGRPNPIVVGDLVICSVFSPGCLVAFDRRTGRRRWHLPLSYYGHSNARHDPDTGLVYGGTAQEILAVDPETGHVRWTFCPYGRKGETIYSSPTVADGRLFVGDRRGYFHCLDAETGNSIWRVHTSRARNNDVNSNPVVVGRVVMVATNAALAIGFNVETGRRLWAHRLDGPATHCRPGRGRTALVRSWASAYQFSVSDGRLVRRWMLDGHRLDEACAAGDLVLLVTNLAGRTDGASWPVSELRAFRRGKEIYSRPYPRSSTPVLRHEPVTGRVYEATSYGLGILDPTTGIRRVVIRFDDGEVPSYEASYTHPPAVEGDTLFAINFDGQVFALRHP